MSYTATQLAHARAIRDVVHARGLTEKALVITLETAMTESGLRVFANANNPESLALPHEAVGTDHASVGIFQQQVPMWGTTADCMDPAKSCGKFLNRLVQHNWQAMSNWEAAQAVQVSAFPDGSNYRSNDAAATALAAQLWGEDMPLTDADVQKIWTWDLANGNPVAQAYQVIDNTQAAVAQLVTTVGELSKKVDALIAAKGTTP